MAKTIVLADDHPALRVGLQRILEEAGEFRVVGEASTAEGLLRAVQETRPDVVVTDLRLAGGSAFETIGQIHRELPQASILVFSGADEGKHVHRALRSGAAGYLLKTGSVQEIVEGVRKVAGGEYHISPGLSGHVVHALLQDDQIEAAVKLLTPREREVLRLVAEGLSSRQIADRLEVSPKTVETHRSRMMGKLDIHKSSKLVRFAIEAGLLGGA